jgi:pimeloyl-ACP methyl ester carboxylesterase
MTRTRPAEPSLIDALAVGLEGLDELIFGGVRQTHTAINNHVHGALSVGTGGLSKAEEVANRSITASVYGAIGLGFAVARAALDVTADHTAGRGPRLEDSPAGRFFSSALNGLVGDQLAEERPRMAIPLAIRSCGCDVRPDKPGFAEAFPEATDKVVLFLHGLCESDESWSRHREEVGGTYAETLAAEGWTPVFVRANTGLPVRNNGAALVALMDALVEDWPVPVERIAFVGHSMGGLIVHAATALDQQEHHQWTRMVTDIVALGAPYLGSSAARMATVGSRRLARLGETRAIAAVLEKRSHGIRDLDYGVGEDVPVPNLPHARYRLVAATKDKLVSERSACGHTRFGRRLFPHGELATISGGHFDLLNHPEINAALRYWLS